MGSREMGPEALEGSMDICLPWVEYEKGVSEEEMGNLVTDAADLYSVISRYEVSVLTGNREESARQENLVLIFSMYLYHMVCQMVDISPLMNPMKILVEGEDAIDTDHGRAICCQISRAYVHYVDGSIKYQRDLYRVIPLLARLLYGTFSDREVLSAYRSVEEYLVKSGSPRLGLRKVS